jgi:hypothetical protein
MLKDKNNSYIRFVLNRVREIYNEYVFFPENILDFIKNEIQDKALTTLLAITKETGVYNFLVPYRKDHQTRFNQFAKRMTGIDKTAFRKMCKAAARRLFKDYGIAPAFGAASYAKVFSLNSRLNISYPETGFSSPEMPIFVSIPRS